MSVSLAGLGRRLAAAARRSLRAPRAGQQLSRRAVAVAALAAPPRRAPAAWLHGGALEARVQAGADAGEWNRTAWSGRLTPEDTGRTVSLCGWLQHRRDFGHMVFCTLRDATGAVQLVFHEADAAVAGLRTLRLESALCVHGEVRRRPDVMVNKDMATGALEVAVDSILAVNEARVLPFPLHGQADKSKEQTRLRHRYLDLRRPSLQYNLKLRSSVALFTRNLLSDTFGFMEIETPTLFKRTPGGAAEFLVPTQDPGKVYSLVQSPQQLKQLLMVAGFERYFQFARCYRDEGGRVDRQPEFTQIDLECSFVSAFDIQHMVEALVSRAFEQFLGARVPHSFPRLSYADAMAKYGTDKPDLRFGMEIVDLGEASGGSAISAEPIAKALQGPDGLFAGLLLGAVEGKPFPRKVQDRLQTMAQDAGAQGVSFVRAGEGGVLEGGIANKMTVQEQQQLGVRLGAQPGHTVLLTWGGRDPTLNALGQLRLECANCMEATGQEVRQAGFNILWVNDFPLFEARKDGGLASTHHCFTAPVDEDRALLHSNPAAVRGQHFDLVINGVEIGGGSMRNHTREAQEHIIGTVLREDPAMFSQLLEALSYGAPPHGGIALGFDRLLMVMCGASSVRDVIAFPKSFQGRDFMANCPEEPSEADRELYHLSFTTPPTPAKA